MQSGQVQGKKVVLLIDVVYWIVKGLARHTFPMKDYERKTQIPTAMNMSDDVYQQADIKAKEKQHGQQRDWNWGK